MLLILHFHGLKIRVGVRVGDVYDEERELDGRRGRVFGWNYRTLEGHVEMGQMDWQVWKFPDSGEVVVPYQLVLPPGRARQPATEARLPPDRPPRAAPLPQAHLGANGSPHGGADGPARPGGRGQRQRSDGEIDAINFLT